MYIGQIESNLNTTFKARV